MSKLDRAKELGVKVIGEKELAGLLGGAQWLARGIRIKP